MLPLPESPRKNKATLSGLIPIASPHYVALNDAPVGRTRFCQSSEARGFGAAYSGLLKLPDLTAQITSFSVGSKRLLAKRRPYQPVTFYPESPQGYFGFRGFRIQCLRGATSATERNVVEGSPVEFSAVSVSNAHGITPRT